MKINGHFFFFLDQIRIYFRKMEPLCFICQEYQSEIGHQTSSCPEVTCKKCGLKGHFGINCEIVDLSITDGEASVFKPDNFIKVKNMKSLLKKELDNQAINDGFSQTEENMLMISGIPQNNEQKQFTSAEESNTKPCETEPLDKLKRQLAEVFERKSNKMIEDLKTQLTASQWAVSEMKTNKDEEIRIIKSDERERYDYLLKVKSDLAQSEKSQLISDEREKYDSLLKSKCERHNKITQNLEKSLHQLENKLRVSVGNLRNENDSLIKESNVLNSKIAFLERCVLLEANQSKELSNKLVKTKALKEEYEKECSLKESRIGDFKECWIKETNSLNMKIENLERCILLKESRIGDFKESWTEETNSLNTKIENLDRCLLLEENRSKNCYNKLVKAEELKENYKKECSIKDSRIKELEKMYKEECSIKDSKIEELKKLYEKECADHVITESVKDGYIDNIQGLYVEINKYQLQLASFKLFNDRQAQDFVIPNKLMKNPNEGHTVNSTVVSATDNGNGNMDITMGNASVTAQKSKQAKKMPESHIKNTHGQKVGLKRQKNLEGSNDIICKVCYRVFQCNMDLQSHLEIIHNQKLNEELPGLNELSKTERNRSNSCSIPSERAAKQRKFNEGHTGIGTDNGNSNMDVTMGNASVVAQKPKQANKMPDSPTKRHPVQLLNELRGGGVTFNMVKSCGVTPNIIFTFECKIDGTQYTGVGPNKKDAKKHCAMDALKILYKIQYPGTRTSLTRTVVASAAAMPTN